MKKLLLLLAVFVSVAFVGCAKKNETSKKPAKTEITPLVKQKKVVDKNDINWFSKLEDAQIEAKKSNKNIFVDFTGSDWCKWCIALDQEVYSHKEFSEYAKENLVMLKFDYPRDTPQPMEVKQYNQEMLKKFGVQGFPTVFILTPDLKMIGRTGYLAGGPVNYINNLQAMITKYDAATKK